MRILLAGLGGWGRVWTRVIREAEGVELAAVVDPSPEALAWAGVELGLPDDVRFDSLDAALARTQADAVVVATPMWTHHAVVMAALRADKHVLCEKPFTTTPDDARSLVEMAGSRGRILMVDQNYRFRRPARAARQVVAGGALGELVGVRLFARRDTRSFWAPDDFRYTIPHFYLLDLGIHHFDLLRAVTGRNAASVYCRGMRVPDSPYEHDAAGVAVVELAGGATAAYDASYACHDPETGWNGEWEITGEAGRLLWRGGRPNPEKGDLSLELWGEAPRPVELPDLPLTGSAAALEAFRVAVASGEQPEASGADNLHSLAIVFGCAESVESGRVVRLAAPSSPRTRRDTLLGRDRHE